jgi:hypothetical protein
MSSNALPSSALLDQLAAGWSRTRPEAARELAERWGRALEAEWHIHEERDAALDFTCAFPQIRLRGMGGVRCLLLAGAERAAATALAESTRQRPSFFDASALSFVLALSADAFAVAKGWPEAQESLLLDRDQLRLLLGAQPEQARAFLVRHLRARLSRLTLNPYHAKLPAEGAMFFGRQRELRELKTEARASFAIVGPSRMGKTSLLRRYHATLPVSRRLHAHYLQFADVNARNIAEVGNRVAVPLGEGASRMSPERLLRVLRHLHCRDGAMLEFLLDETDGVCDSAIFHALATADREGYCRLILCGRGRLLREMRSSHSPLAGRLTMMRLSPLESADARSLLECPLVDLELDLAPGVVERVLELTGHSAHLIQYYGGCLARLGCAGHGRAITLEDVEAVRSDFNTAEMVMAGLDDLECDLHRRVALTILAAAPKKPFTAEAMVRIATAGGYGIDPFQAHEICRDLVINNILTWCPHGDSPYALTNPGLAEYARRAGLLPKLSPGARVITHANFAAA